MCTALCATRVLVGTGTSDTYGYVGVSETVARIASVTGGVTTNTDSIVSATGDRIGVKVGGTVNWLLPDLHGNTGASLSADEAAVTNAIRYDAYGMTLATGNGAGAPDPVGDKAWTYQGRLDISPEGLATPLYDMGARFYAPGIGGFTQLDSVMGSAQNPLSMNRFLYAQGNPATLVDPDGHAACSAYADYCPTNGSATRHTVQKTRSQHSYAQKGYNERRESVYERSRGTARIVNNRKVSVLPKRVVPSSAQKVAQNRARVADDRTRFSTDEHDAAVEAVRNHQAPDPGEAACSFLGCVGAAIGAANDSITKAVDKFAATALGWRIEAASQGTPYVKAGDDYYSPDALEGTARTLSKFGKGLLGVSVVIGTVESFDREFREGASKGRGLPEQLGRGLLRSAFTGVAGYAGSSLGAPVGFGIAGLFTDNPAGAVAGTFVGSWAGGVAFSHFGDLAFDEAFGP